MRYVIVPPLRYLNTFRRLTLAAAAMRLPAGVCGDPAD